MMVRQSKYAADSPSRAGALDLVAYALALDFVNTSSARDTPAPLEHLREPADIVAWALRAGIVDENGAGQVRAALAAGDPGWRDFLGESLGLRETIYRAVTAIAAAKRPDSADLNAIKSACARAIAAGELTAANERFVWSWPQDPPTMFTILGPIIMSAVGLFREADPKRLKQCGGEHCGWVFFDLSKNNSRRWCEMRVCGNRAKARRFYARKT